MLGAFLLSAVLAYPGLHTKPCPIGPVQATCGSLTVFEDRAAQRGRTIDLHFVLIHAKHRTGHVLAFNPGGPGASSTQVAGAVAGGQFFGEFTTLRDKYDVLLLDNRGTGLLRSRRAISRRARGPRNTSCKSFPTPKSNAAGRVWPCITI